MFVGREKELESLRFTLRASQSFPPYLMKNAHRISAADLLGI